MSRTYHYAGKKSESESQREIVREFQRWNNDTYFEGEAVGSYDFPPPRSVGDSKAAVRFVLRGTTITVECESQPTYRQNLRCVFFAVEAMRMNEKRGIADTMRKAYLQIEAPPDERDPYEILGLRPDADPEVIEAVYRKLAQSRHPDAGGSEDAMRELNRAYERIKQDRDGT